MAASTSVLAPINDTDANFRLWASAISAAFSAAGWVQTADTGQINLATVSKPAGANTSQGYQIWGTNDGGGRQAWYVKIEYGSGGAASTPAIWLTHATASNGAGTLTGQVSTRKQIKSSGNTATTYSCYFGGGTNWFACSMFSQSVSDTAYGMQFAFERTLDSAGAVTDVGMCCIAYSPGGGDYLHQTIPKTGTIWAQDTTDLPSVRMRSATLVDGSTIGTMPICPMIQVHYPAMLAAVGVYASDIGEGTSFTVSRYGTNRTYMMCRTRTNATAEALGSYSGRNYAIAIRYE